MARVQRTFVCNAPDRRLVVGGPANYNPQEDSESEERDEHEVIADFLEREDVHPILSNEQLAQLLTGQVHNVAPKSEHANLYGPRIEYERNTYIGDDEPMPQLVMNWESEEEKKCDCQCQRKSTRNAQHAPDPDGPMPEIEMDWSQPY